MSSHYLFVNTNARRVNPRVVSDMQKELRRIGLACEVVLTRSVEHAAQVSRAAAQSGAEIALVAGGDGSINAVAQGLTGFDTALGIIPLGTGNVLARELSLPLDWRQAIRALSGLQPHRIDMGHSPAGSFLLMAGIGLDTQVIKGVGRGLKQAIGRAAFALSAFRALPTFKPFAARIMLDGQAIETEAWQVVVSNSAGYAGVITLAPDASYYDGLLDVIILPSGTMPVGRLALRTMSNILWGRDLRGAIRRRCRKVIIETDPPVGVQLDGDPRSVTPLEAEVIPAAIRLLAPGSDPRSRGSEVQS